MVAVRWSLTSHLLGRREEFEAATQHPFLLAAAEGRLSKDDLGRWLSNDRLYIHSYIKAAGKMLGSLDLPQQVPEREAYETQLVDWLIEALTAVRREERFFIDVADRYGLSIDLGTQMATVARENSGLHDSKLPGLVMIEGIFANLAPPAMVSAVDLPPNSSLPWLEAAVTFWGTEKCYLDAWTWARNKQIQGANASRDADGGALRKEFIPNWSSPEFRAFVDKLGVLIDSAVDELVKGSGNEEEAIKAVTERIDPKWISLLAAEAAFWPDIE